MSQSPDLEQKRQIDSTLVSILDASRQISDSFRRRLRRVRVAKALLTGLLIWTGLVSVTIGVILTQYTRLYFFENREFLLALGGVLLSIAVAGGAASYAFLWGRPDKELDELSQLISRSREPEGSQDPTVAALSLSEKVLELLPRIVRRRNQDALLFGIVAFLVATIIALPPTGIVVGVIVWLYFRHETGRLYEREVSRLEEQRRSFEDRKREFLETL